MRLIYIYILEFLFATQVAGAASADTTLKSIIQLAVEKNLEAQARNLEVTAKRAKSAQVSKWDDPNLEFGIDKKDDSQGATNFQRVGITQNISRPGRIQAREDLATNSTAQSELDRGLYEIELRGRVLELIYAYQVSVEKALHAKERYDRFKTVEIYLRSRTFAAPQKRAEATIVRSKQLVLRKDLRELESLRRVAWNNLNLFLGFDKERVFQVPWYKYGEKIELSGLIKKAETQNPEYRRQGLRLKDKDIEAKLAEYEAWPGLTLSAVYNNGSGANPEKSYGLGLALPIPIWNGNRENSKAFRAEADAEAMRLKFAQSRLEVEINSAFQLYQSASESIRDLSPEKIQAQEREMREVDSGFRKGQIDLITYLEADAQHFDVMNTILDMQKNYLSALRSLLFLAGEAPQPLEQ